MSGTTAKPRKRLTRQESQAQTRATLLTVGREHFLRYGLGGAVAEKIAEDAGSPRGAALALLMLGEAELLGGHLDEAEDHLKEAAGANDRGGPESRTDKVPTVSNTNTFVPSGEKVTDAIPRPNVRHRVVSNSRRVATSQI